jgi:RNA polymerase sigma-70 factor (ECF subfamily)
VAQHDEGFPTAPEESVSMDLVRRIQAGERAAWNELYARYHDQLLLSVRMRLGAGLRRHLESEDIFQSVALEAFRALERFEYRGTGSLERFLNTLVVNKIRDRADLHAAAKRGGAHAPEPLDESAHAPRGPSYHDAERYERLERALNALAPEEREWIVLRKLEGLSSQEAARHFGCSDEAARKAFSRAMARLAALLGAGGP